MTASTSAVLSLLDAAYRTTPPDDAWLQGVIEAAREVFDRGLGLNGYFVDASRPDRFGAWGLQSSGRDHVEELNRFEQWSQGAPLELKRAAHLCGPAAFASQLAPAGDDAVERSFEITGWADVLGICALDASGLGCALAVPCPSRVANTISQAETTLWGRLAAHLATGARLRRQLASIARPPEAVLSPSGRVEHAEGPARAESARQRLRDAARGFDRARTKPHADPLEATRLWRALTAGRWSLVDQFDRDGRRYIVARDNEPAVDPWSRLSKREAQVLRAAAFGHSNKVIAYELGLAASTVSGCLRRAATKLGLRNRLELIRACAASSNRDPLPPPTPSES